MLRSKPTDQCLTVLLEGGGPGPYPEEWPDGQSEFTSELCEDVRIIDSTRLLIVPAGDLDLQLPCPHCRQDILPELRVQARDLDGDELSNPYPWLAASGYFALPSSWPRCRRVLDPLALAARSEEEVIDEVPFFCFGLALLAAHEPTERATYADPDLLATLQSLTGVPFRSTGRWE